MALVNEALVRVLAKYADLPISSAREQLISPTLEIWIENANALSKRMSAAEYSGVGPVTVFRHDCETDEFK